MFSLRLIIILFTTLPLLGHWQFDQKSIRNVATETTTTESSDNTSTPSSSICPEGTKLVSKETPISPKTCLRDYIDLKTEHGITRKKTCYHMGTKHERSLRIPKPNQIYASVSKDIPIQTKSGDATVHLIANHAFYRLQWKANRRGVPNHAKAVKKDFLDADLPKTVTLQRCVCDTTKFTQEKCLELLTPVMSKTFSQ